MNFTNLFKLDDDILKIPAGATLLDQGDVNDRMYVLLEGTLEVRLGGQTIEVLGPGGIVGEMSLIEKLPVSADVTAYTACKLAEVDENRFRFLIQNHPFFALEVMKIMAQRLRRSNSR